MKTIKSIIFLLITGNALAQIPNNGFENWTSMGSYENPDSWGTMNNTTAISSIYTATKGSPGYAGNFCLKLTSKTIGPAVVNGIAVSGKLDSTTLLPKSGFPYTVRSANFIGRWQHMLSGTSQGGITILLTQWNTTLNKRDTIAMANYTLTGMAMSWTAFSIPLTYLSGNNPDSCIIFLRASGSNPTNGDYLWVDELNFSGTVTGIENNVIINTISVFPNPSSDQIHLSFEIKEAQNINFELLDMTGKVVLLKNLGLIYGTINETISTIGLAKGTYLLKLNSSKEFQTRKISIE